MDGRRLAERVAATLGVLGLLAVLPFFVASGLAAPFWAVVVLLAVWLLLLVVAIRSFSRSPWLVLVLPVVAAAIWWLTMTLGESVLGWQA